jgi:tripartite ATP-independent transporter DctM subunit
MTLGIIVFIVMFVIIFLSSMPLALGMLSLGVVYMVATGGNLTVIANAICEAYWNNYVIIAIPLFVFTANVMNTGKISDMIFRFADGLVGRVRGGMAQVNVVVSLIFSGMTGSAMADASGLGIMEIAEMRRQGYDDGFSCAITAASATIGPIFPPSMTMLLYSSISGASVGALFMGGMLPGILLAVFLGIYCLFIANKRKYPYGTKYTLPIFISYSIKAFPALLTPVILLGGIYGGAVTPTEAGAVAGLYALIVSILVYRMLNWESLKTILLDTVRTVGTVSITVGCASVIVYISTLERIPSLLGGFVMGLTNNKYVFLFLCNLLFLALGMIFDNNTITLVFIPMIFPLLKPYGIDSVHFGVVFVINMMIGMLSPPYGPLLFVTSAISDTPLKDIIREILPMLAVMLIFLFLMTYIPDIILILPKIFLHYRVM